MRSGVNLLTKIFRDTHAPRYQRQAVSLVRSYRRPSRAPVRGCPIKLEFAEGERYRIYLPQHEPKSEKKAVVPGGLSERKKVERRKRERARERKKGTRV